MMYPPSGLVRSLRISESSISGRARMLATQMSYGCLRRSTPVGEGRPPSGTAAHDTTLSAPRPSTNTWHVRRLLLFLPYAHGGLPALRLCNTCGLLTVLFERYVEWHGEAVHPRVAVGAVDGHGVDLHAVDAAGAEQQRGQTCSSGQSPSQERKHHTRAFDVQHG